jgi:hypothetical protein
MKMLYDPADTLKNQIFNYGFFNFGEVLNNEKFIESSLMNTAWETSKSTGIISEYDHETLKDLTAAYSLQDQIQNKTLDNILKLYYAGETHKKENVQQTFTQFHLMFWEITTQEKQLDSLYTSALNALN